MGKDFFSSAVAIVGLFTGVAIVAALVSKNSQTPAVLNSYFGGIATGLHAALSPITGASGVGSFGGG